MSTERSRRIDVDARIIWELLRGYNASDRFFALAEIIQIVNRRLKSRESSQYHVGNVEFTRDEPPTLPNGVKSPNLGDTETRAIKTSDLEILKKKTRE